MSGPTLGKIETVTPSRAKRRSLGSAFPIFSEDGNKGRRPAFFQAWPTAATGSSGPEARYSKSRNCNPRMTKGWEMAIQTLVTALVALIASAPALPASADEHGAEVRIADTLSVGAARREAGRNPPKRRPDDARSAETRLPPRAAPAPGAAEGQSVTGLAKAPPLPRQPSAAYRAPNPAGAAPSTLVGPTAQPGPQTPAVGGPGSRRRNPIGRGAR